MTEREIFEQALEHSDAERNTYLNQACGGDSALRLRIEALLNSNAANSHFLSIPAVEQLRRNASNYDETVTVDSAKEERSNDDKDDGDLSFLQPPTRRGSLGRLGQYEILEILGKGGFGIVFRAFDEVLQRVVAVKVLAPEMATHSPARKRFLREAQSSAQVRHENVVQIYAVEENPVPYLVMEFIRGETLQQRLNRTGPLSAMEVVRLGQQIAEGLAAAHATDLIHRDIKPANILITASPREQAKITDFGLARAADDASLTQSGVVAGTPMFMAPEQAGAEELDHRADLFSLGSVLYTLISGRPPFRAGNTLAVLKRVVEDTPRPIREIIREAPQWLCDIISKLHAKNPDKRFGSASEAAQLLGQGLAALEYPGSVQPPQVAIAVKAKKAFVAEADSPSASAPRKRRWAVAAAIFLMLFSAIGITEATGVTDFRGRIVHLFSPEKARIAQEVAETNADEPKPTEAKTNNTKKKADIAKPPVERKRIIPKVAERRAAEYVLSIGGNIRLIGDDRDIRDVKDLPTDEIRIFDVGLNQNQKVTDEGLAVFEDCVNPTVLALYGCRQITDAGLAHFKNCKGMTIMVLEHVNVSDAGLAYFKDFKNLSRLHLDGTGVTDKGLVHLEDLNRLIKLRIVNPEVTEKGVAALAKKLPHCEIKWNGGVIEKTAIVDVDRLAAEYILSIGGIVRVNDAGDDIKTTDQLPKEKFRLTVVYLDSNKNVTDDELAVFDDCENVSAIIPAATKMGDRGLAHFRKCKNLKTIWGGGEMQITDAGLGQFKQWPELDTINLGEIKTVGDAGMVHLIECKSLANLWLQGTSVGDAGLAHVGQIKGLKFLNLVRTEASDAGLSHLTKLENLTELKLQQTNVTDKGIKKLADALPKCKIEWDGGVVDPK